MLAKGLLNVTCSKLGLKRHIKYAPIVNISKKNSPICPIKLVSQKQVLSPKAPPQVNSDLRNVNSNNREKNAMITKEFLAKIINGTSDFCLIKSSPNLIKSTTTIIDGNPNPQ